MKIPAATFRWNTHLSCSPCSSSLVGSPWRMVKMPSPSHSRKRPTEEEEGKGGSEKEGEGESEKEGEGGSDVCVSIRTQDTSHSTQRTGHRTQHTARNIQHTNSAQCTCVSSSLSSSHPKTPRPRGSAWSSWQSWSSECTLRRRTEKEEGEGESITLERGRTVLGTSTWFISTTHHATSRYIRLF